jgi:DHA1 family inner membrane transport protein
VLSAFAPIFAVLLAARVLLGSISGALLAVGVTFIPELVGAKRSSGALTLVYASYSVALIVATSVSKILASTVGWHVAMYGTLVLSLVASALLAACMPRSGQTDEPATAREQARLFGEPSIIAGMLVFVFGIGSVYTFYGYVTPYMEQVLGMDAVAVSGALVVYGVITFGSNLLSGWVDMRFGTKALVVVFLAQAAILAGLYVAGSSMPAALVLVMLVGLVMYVASIPSVSHFMDVARRRYPKALTLASSLEPLSFNGGIAFGTFVGGVVVSGPGIGAVGLVGAVLAVIAAVLVGVTLALSRREEARG